MKKNNTKRILVFFVLSFFILSLIASFALAQADNPATGEDNPVFDPIKDMFVKWEKGNLTPNIAKYLFWAILTLIVYSVAGMLPGLDGKNMGAVKWILSIIVGFLAIAYVTPEDIYGLMSGYSAMGFVLGGFLPIIVLLTFTWNLAANSKGAHQFAVMRLLTWFMWAGYTLFSVMKIIWPPEGAPTIGHTWVAFVFAAFGVLMLIFNGSVFKYLKLKVTEAEIETFEDKVGKQTAKLRADSAAVEAAAK